MIKSDTYIKKNKCTIIFQCLFIHLTKLLRCWQLINIYTLTQEIVSIIIRYWNKKKLNAFTIKERIIPPPPRSQKKLTMQKKEHLLIFKKKMVAVELEPMTLNVSKVVKPSSHETHRAEA